MSTQRSMARALQYCYLCLRLSSVGEVREPHVGKISPSGCERRLTVKVGFALYRHSAEETAQPAKLLAAVVRL